MKTIAITGAAGLVGTGLRRELLQRAYALQLLDVKSIDPCYANERSVVVDITDQAALTAALRGCDAVVHLAACTTDAPWPQHVKLSIEGSISLFDAAREAGVLRVVYASSHHVVGLHPRAPNGPRLGTAAQVRPDSRYAVGKAFGESIGAMYAGKYGMQVLAIRIGNVNTRPIDRRRLGNWLSWRDLGQLVALGVEHPDLVFSVVYGVSDSSGRHYDNAAAHALGYRPQDGTAAAAFDAQVLQEDPPPAAGSAASRSAAELTLGGQFSQNEFVGDTARLLV
ncbi:MAG TPA: NAD(P)-dependent oxidoreductase [Burkholderiaceae bacterium]|jgi:uronate dehydrogenase|nr:NAD(P)-dependent oxidoreductase [Burkholderiaceae bacterium]HPH13748.1 NAD(P)-dependent oxidoreductase [Burkholderiaceae bacterium]